ncbi:RNA methyltransferase [Paenibacillus sp. MWE-103]|uniref:RNA methyltransferase n=2 Tax=Paenibacillus artemisiicola TaxID=1172618 RepID=A0ABS3WBE2_9BACL|nr:RNA methyltransferase [Paenibacillus artemisiicola]
MHGPERPVFLYPVASHEDERDLFLLEMRALFGAEPVDGCVISDKNVDPSRSPFIRGRLAVTASGGRPEDIAAYAADAVRLEGRTFKVTFVCGEPDYDAQRAAERTIGWRIAGKAEMRRPERLFGVAFARGRYWFGEYAKSEAAWLKHNDKPQPYSTALGTRVARAVVNLAVPDIRAGLRAVDPCCGIGTVLIEALSMGIDIVGYDVNPLALKGARLNLAHFGMPDVVKLADMTTLAPGPEGPCDAAVLDLPYNLCSVLPEDERLAMLRAARRLARRVVVVTTETIDAALAQAGLRVLDRAAVRKGKFERHVLVCEGERAKRQGADEARVR